MAEFIPLQKYCVYCARLKDTQRDFYPNNSKYLPFHKMAYCKDCSREISDKIFNQNASFERNTREMCIVFQMPYLNNVKDAFQEEINRGVKVRQVDYLYQYLRALKDCEIQDEYWDDLCGATYLGLDILKNTKPIANEDVETLQALEKDWGKQNSIYEYGFLEERYAEYIQGQELSPAALTTIRYLCLAELEVKKLKASHEDSTKAEDKVMKYYKSLKLDNFNISGDKPLIEQTLENWTIIEETKEPIEWKDEHLEDICGFQEDYDEILRCIGNKVIGDKRYPKLSIEDVENVKKKGGKNSVRKTNT